MVYHPPFQAVLEDAHMPSNLNAKSWMVAGAGSALIAALLVYPADMLKTRLIVQNVKPSLSHYRGIMHGFRKIWKAEGFLALYKGLLPTFLGKCFHTYSHYVTNNEYYFTFKNVYFYCCLMFHYFSTN